MFDCHARFIRTYFRASLHVPPCRVCAVIFRAIRSFCRLCVQHCHVQLLLCYVGGLFIYKDALNCGSTNNTAFSTKQSYVSTQKYPGICLHHFAAILKYFPGFNETSIFCRRIIYFVTKLKMFPLN